jgi:hypothetical protein
MRRHFTAIYAETNDLSRVQVGNAPEGEFSNLAFRERCGGSSLEEDILGGLQFKIES